jgi:hypothetical protein
VDDLGRRFDGNGFEADRSSSVSRSGVDRTDLVLLAVQRHGAHVTKEVTLAAGEFVPIRWRF